MVSSGGIIFASDMNKALASRVPVSQVSDPAATGTFTTTETVIATIPATLYRANTAFQVVADGFWNNSVNDNQVYLRLRKVNVSGTVVCDWTRVSINPAGGNSFYQFSNRFTTTAAVTTSLVLTAQRTAGTGTINFIGTAGRPRRVIVWEIGDQGDYVDDHDLI